MEKFVVIFAEEEMELLEKILKKSITSYDGIAVFTLTEMEEMEHILEKAVRINFDKWLDFAHEQMNAGREEITPDMRMQWKYTGRIEELYDRIARPLGKSKRCDEKELLKYL